MRFTLNLGSLLFVAAAPTIAAAQARVQALSPDASKFRAERLGSFVQEPVDTGMNLLPGDLLSGETGAQLELNCPEGSANSYYLDGPFRVLIDIPSDSTCHVNLLGGSVDVLAESGTSVTAGGVEMGSVSTQYAVRLDENGTRVVPKLLVFDGSVRVSTPRGRQRVVRQGLALPLDPDRPSPRPQAITSEETQRSAAIYSNLDIARAAAAGAQISDSSAVAEQFKTLHYQVLESPADTAKRAALARFQIRYQINNAAIYNLKRVDLTDEQSLNRYDIDSAALQRGLTTANRDFYISRLRPEGRMAVVRTTDTDLELIAAGKLDEAIESLISRVEAGSATSRDYYALSRAYFELKDVRQSESFGKQALKLNERDQMMSEREVEAQQTILNRIRG